MQCDYSTKNFLNFRHFSQTLNKKFVKNDEFLADEAGRAQAETLYHIIKPFVKMENCIKFNKKSFPFFVQNDDVKNQLKNIHVFVQNDKMKKF